MNLEEKRVILSKICPSVCLLRRSDGRLRICWRERDSMDPSCLVPAVQTASGGVMVWGSFSWHTLGAALFKPSMIEMSVGADHVSSFIITEHILLVISDCVKKL
uniref:Uncharacterized protein n=1 Tax=Salarias fasciatus TaxID=181472 RepID=A0A672JB55_SALFA